MITQKEVIKYSPNYFGDKSTGWNDKAVSLAGHLSKKYGHFYEDPEDFIEQIVLPVAESWVKLDPDPDPKYEWATVLEAKANEYWMNDYNHEDFVPTPVGTGSGDIVVFDGIHIAQRSKGGPEGQRVPLLEALNKTWYFDAFLIPYIGSDYRESCKDCASGTVSVRYTYLCIDVDGDDHKMSEQEKEEHKEIIDNDPELSKYFAFYTTRGGYRVIYKPHSPITREQWLELSEYYTYLYKRKNITVDPAPAKKPENLIRLPNVLRDGEPYEAAVLDIRETSVDLNKYSYVENFIVDENEDGKEYKLPKPLKSVIADIYRVTGGWPRSVGGQLFYLSNNEVKYIDDSTELFSWLANQTTNPPHIIEKAGFLNKREIFSGIRGTTLNYSSLDHYPFYPPKEDAYVMEDLSGVTGVGGKFDELLGFFNPSTKADRVLLKAAFCSPMSNFGLNPIFTVESDSIRGVGKTTLVKMIGQLYGGYASTKKDQLVGNSELEFARKLLSAEGRKKRVLLIDNVVGFFKSSALAELITSQSIVGRLPYAKQETSRSNDLTWFVTSNDGEFDKDYISRSVFLKLDPPAVEVEGWESKVLQFVNTNRLQILKEIENIIKQENTEKWPVTTRFYDWEIRVLQQCCKDLDEYSEVTKAISVRKDDSDADSSVCSEILRILMSELKDPDNSNYIIPQTELINWCTNKGIQAGKKSLRSILNEATATGGIPGLSRRRKYSGKISYTDKRKAYIWGSETDKDNPPKTLTFGMF